MAAEKNGAAVGVAGRGCIRMKQRILAYRLGVDALLSDGLTHDWAALRAEHLVQIAFFQNERLIHLIVTATFAILEVLAAAVTVLAFSPAALLLCAAVLILLIPYIAHYYLLENEVQRLYEQYDRIAARCPGLEPVPKG
jgi:fatty acid desaturase